MTRKRPREEIRRIVSVSRESVVRTLNFHRTHQEHYRYALRRVTLRAACLVLGQHDRQSSVRNGKTSPNCCSWPVRWRKLRFKLLYTVSTSNQPVSIVTFLLLLPNHWVKRKRSCSRNMSAFQKFRAVLRHVRKARRLDHPCQDWVVCLWDTNNVETADSCAL